MSAPGGCGAGGGTSPTASPGSELLTFTVVRNEHGYGMKVSGDNPVYVQSVKEGGPAWRAGLRAGDRIVRVNGSCVPTHTHLQVVQMIRASATVVLTVYQNSQRHKTPITAPVPVDQEKQRQLEFTKVSTIRLMLENEQKHMELLRNELSKSSDSRKQAELESAEQRCLKLQHQIDIITSSLPHQDIGGSTPQLSTQPQTPRLGNRSKFQTNLDKNSSTNNSTGFLSGLPRSLSNLTGQSLRNLRQVKQNMTNKGQQENQPPVERHEPEDVTSKRSRHNNTVPMVPITCLDANIAPPPLPPRSTDRQKPKRNPLSPPPSHIPINPLAKPPKMHSPSSSISQSPVHRWSSPQKEFQSPYKSKISPQYSMDVPNTQKTTSSPPYRTDCPHKYRRSAHSLDTEYGTEMGNGQPNSIAMQMSYPLVSHPQPSVQTDIRGSGIPVLHIRSQSSPEHLDHGQAYGDQKDGVAWERTPPPGTPPPPYPHARPTDTQRAIISMEEDDSPASDNSCNSGLFSNLRSVRESRARTAVLLNWLLGERRCASANIFLLITDGYRSAAGVPIPTLQRWAYEIQSTFVMPNSVLAINGVDENMAREIDDVFLNEYNKEELLRNVFRKARAKAKEELAQQLSEFQVKRQVGLGMLYGPEDSVLEKCDVDKAQESTVVERLVTERLACLVGSGEGDVWGCGAGSPAHAPLLAASAAAALLLHVRPQAVTAAVGGGARAAFLQRDKLYKQRLKQIVKQTPQPFVVRGHHFSLQAVTSVTDCQHCATVIWGLAPQAYVCSDCDLRVHRSCARKVEESCCLDGEQHNNRISRFIEKIQANTGHQEGNEKKSRKISGPTHFLNMERSARRLEDEPTWEPHQTAQDRRDESDESLYESAENDPISASDDALPRLGRLQIGSKESVKLAVTDEESDGRNKKGHRKALSLSNPIEMVKNLGDEWFEAAKRELDKNCDRKKSKESLWSEEDRDSIHGSNAKLNERKGSKKEEKKKGTMDPPKSTKKVGSSALNLFRRKKKTIEPVAEKEDRVTPPGETISSTIIFLEAEKRHSCECEAKPIIEIPLHGETADEPDLPEETVDDSDQELEAEDEESEEQTPVKLTVTASRRRLSRTTSRSKSKVRGKSQTVKVNTLRKSQSGTLKRAKKKNIKAASTRSRNASMVEQTPILKKKVSETRSSKWPFSASIKGEARREGSAEESACADQDHTSQEQPVEKDDKDGALWRASKPVNRAESCREPAAASRRGKQRNASDPNKLTASRPDCEPGTGAAPSGSSSSSSLSSRSNESGAPAAEHHASQSDWSEEEEPLAEQWSATVAQHIVDSLSARLRKRQELIHELITSESSHVRWLKVLQTVFLRPLERGEHGQLLSTEEVKALFPNLPAVRERHNRLYADLKVLRKGDNQVVQIRPLADAMLNTLGDASYASCLSRFCRGQRMALDALRERRRKNKELQLFLSNKEAQPLCGRLQLRDLLAVVWQRLTKYQLLLEGVLKTVSDEDAMDESGDDTARLRLALDTAKDVLHRVDTAIRTAENEHRLRSIQSKLEVRGGPGTNSAELEEMRRLDLTQHTLLFEGDLSIRTDTNKKSNVLALLMAECLILLQREGDKFVLKQMSSMLTPIIKWSTVLFRPNAAVKNTFFLMNINGVQMYELSANSPTEYNAWTKYILEAPLAEARAGRAPSIQHGRGDKTEDSSGGGVSRNASDASRTSASSNAPEEPESHSTPEKPIDRSSVEPTDRSSVEPPAVDRSSAERPVGRLSEDREKTPEKPEEEKPKLTMNGRITTHEFDPPPLTTAIHVETMATAQFAQKAVSTEERLRRLDEGISKALKAKSLLVADMLGVPTDSFNAVADLAIAETLEQLDVSRDLKTVKLERAESIDAELPPGFSGSSVHQLLLAAQAQANQLTEALTKALNVTEADVISARHYAPWRDSGLCDTCTKRRTKDTKKRPDSTIDNAQNAVDDLTKLSESINSEDVDKSNDPNVCKVLDASGMEKEVSFDMLSELGRSEEGGEDKEQRLDSIVLEEIGESSTDPVAGGATGAYDSALATRLVPLACGLQTSLAKLLQTLPSIEEERARLRRELAAERDAHDALRRQVQGRATEDVLASSPLDSVHQSGSDQTNSGG